MTTSSKKSKKYTRELFQLLRHSRRWCRENEKAKGFVADEDLFCLSKKKRRRKEHEKLGRRTCIMHRVPLDFNSLNLERCRLILTFEDFLDAHEWV